MRKLWLVCATLLLSAAWMAAQTGAGAQSSGTAQSGAQTGATAQTGQTGNMGGQSSGTYGQTNAGKTTLEGCLSGAAGNYTLTANNGMTYQLQGNNNKLSKHIGQEVKVKGSAAVAATSGMGTAQSAASTASQQSFEVSKVKKVSKTCTTGNTSNPSSR